METFCQRSFFLLTSLCMPVLALAASPYVWAGQRHHTNWYAIHFSIPQVHWSVLTDCAGAVGDQPSDKKRYHQHIGLNYIHFGPNLELCPCKQNALLVGKVNSTDKKLYLEMHNQQIATCYTLNNIGSLEGTSQENPCRVLLGLHGNSTERFFLKNLECSSMLDRRLWDYKLVSDVGSALLPFNPVLVWDTVHAAASTAHQTCL